MFVIFLTKLDLPHNLKSFLTDKPLFSDRKGKFQYLLSKSLTTAAKYDLYTRLKVTSNIKR